MRKVNILLVFALTGAVAYAMHGTSKAIVHVGGAQASQDAHARHHTGVSKAHVDGLKASKAAHVAHPKH